MSFDVEKLSSVKVKSIFSSLVVNRDLIEHYKKQALVLTEIDYIWKVLTSSRFSVYSARMDRLFLDNCIDYIQDCVRQRIPIHIVMAGMPGKCANTEKVRHRTPDLGEIAALWQLDLLNSIIKLKYIPGIRFTFFSDYVGLKYSFFPMMSDIEIYLHFLRNWIEELRLPIDILYVTEILPQLNTEFLDVYPQKISTYSLFKKDMKQYRHNQQLYNSMQDNMNLITARNFYSLLGYLPSAHEIVCAAAKQYSDFWNYWSEMKAVENYFGSIIYASPVAYHPDKRLCVRLQHSAARVAPWNGCGIVDFGNIYSIDERSCISNHYMPIVDKGGYFWGYLKQ